jgi:hypothetical protein
MKMIRLVMPAILLTTACAAIAATPQRVSRDEVRLAQALRGLTPGKPQDCLPNRRIPELRSFPKTILYVEGRNRVWRNDTVGTCAGLARDDLPVVISISGRTCAGDIVQTRSRVGGTFTGSCALGKFVPYTK